MPTFIAWCRTNGFTGMKSADEAIDAMMAMMSAFENSYHRIHRVPNSNVKTRADAAVRPHYPANTANMTPQQKAVAFGPLLGAADTFVQGEITQGGQDLAAAVQRLANQWPAIGPLDDVRLPDAYFGNPFDQNIDLERTIALHYFDYMISAMDDYVSRGVPHSNRTKETLKTFKDALNSFRGNGLGYSPGKETAPFWQVFTANKIPGLEGATTIQEVARFWHKKRTGTRKRISRMDQACGNVGGADPNGKQLRRFGSFGESQSVQSERGFYQKEGVSFEQYKWFCDMAIPNATTSVSDSQATFWVELKSGARGAINALKEIYDKKDEPPVMHKPDMGGEQGCFGVHEDCLPLFNRRMISKIKIVHKNPAAIHYVTPV